MRTKPLLLLLAVMVAVTGCAPEDATLPLAPPELAVAGDALAADSTSDDDDLVCEWGPVEGQDGVWEVLCYRANDSASTGLCWYIVTYRCTKNICVFHSEQLLGCDGGEEECTEEQEGIKEEYDNLALYNPRDREKTQWTCSMFDDTDFTSGTGTHGHSVGFITETFAAKRDPIKKVYPGKLTITSDWRCPQGNANLPTPGSINSHHMEGNGGDFAKKDGAALTLTEWEKLRDKGLELGAIRKGISSYGTSGTFTYTGHIHIDWRTS